MKLVDDFTLKRIQNNLLESRELQSLHGSWWFNGCMLFFIASIFICFMYFQYTSTSRVLKAEETRKNIPVTGFAWNNPGIRNAIDL
jgi:cytochrome c biogenesis protein ResB